MTGWKIAGLLVLLYLGAAGCAPAPIQFHNTANPSAGKPEFDQDTDQCRRENSHPTTFVGTYAEVAGTKVDEDKVQSCMAARGWRPASN
jgi:hypothetical protein